MRPSQVRYATALSSPSTVATESSRSTIVVTADSSTTSATPAWCWPPTRDSGLIFSSTCRPWRRSRMTFVGRARELAGVGQRGDQRPVFHAVLRDVGVAALGEREQLVQQLVGRRDHLRAALLVVARREVVVLRERVGAVEGVEERAPAGVGGVERVARHGGGHHQLRARHLGDLRVDAGHAEVRDRVRHQVADLGEERGVGVRVAGPVLAVPGVDLFLQLVPAGEQRGDPAREPVLEVGERRPEPVGLDVEAGEQLVDDEGTQGRIDPQVAGHVRNHRQATRARPLP